jgi:branched-chain amino acid aminotransferase
MSTPSFDDRDGVIWLDGQFVDWRDAKIHVLTHAMHYASAVFEGERAYEGKVFKLTEHSQRLERSAELLGFKLPYSVAEIDAATAATLKRSGFADAYVRPIAWRGSEQMGVSAQQSQIHLAIAVWQWPAYFNPESLNKGIRMTFAKWRRPSPETAPTAEAEGCADALMLDWRGQIAEATGANVFLGIGGELHTPKPDCFLDGITRRTVIDLARKRGIKVTERAIMPEELAKADEVFITGTAAEVTPVGEIGPHNYQVGPLARQMMADYAATVRGRPLAA